MAVDGLRDLLGISEHVGDFVEWDARREQNRRYGMPQSMRIAMPEPGTGRHPRQMLAEVRRVDGSSDRRSEDESVVRPRVCGQSLCGLLATMRCRAATTRSGRFRVRPEFSVFGDPQTSRVLRPSG